ncbi:unnamed protein product [Adineta ricciae]|uniref:Uncharacterized protein n=1 Tax=Adineta ricciae TaxID=249248 RepID=A0A814PX79_ADIRI|nr:unnamed protein product [Adineta ricciae]
MYKHMMKPIDLRKLAKNFSDEKSKEDRHWQRNDAKFRAVHQRCATYDEFKQIVEAAHLRPLDRNETLTLERQPISWNQPATKSSALSSSTNTSAQSNFSSFHQQITFTAPKNITEFIQQWRRITDDMKLEYLSMISNLEHLFQADIPADLLHELPLLYQSNATEKNAELITNVLLSLSQSKRFELIKSFLTDKDKYELNLLFSRLCSFAKLRFSVYLLKEMYFTD